ncbi:MAG: hypothetical protein EON54_23420, partial [Alcaligenaceae bacterium]
MTDENQNKESILIHPHRPTKALFGLGSLYATPAVVRHLELHGRFPAELLGYHAGGEWGQLPSEDAAANDRAVKDGSRILSAYVVEGRRIWVITDAADDDGVRSST